MPRQKRRGGSAARRRAQTRERGSSRREGLLKGEGSASAERDHLAMRLQALSSVLRDVGLLTSGADARLIANLDRRSALDALARTLGPDRVEKSFDAVTTRARRARAQCESEGRLQTGWPSMFTNWLV